MKRNIVIDLIVFITVTATAAATEYKLFYLGGQSNMDGYGYVKELTEDLKKPVEGVMIFHGNTVADGQAVDGRGAWSQLKPGHGAGYQHDGSNATYSNRFGLELTFARRLKELYPNDRIAIIKYSRSGTSIDIEAAGQFGCWEPDYNKGTGPGKGINQYDHFLATVRNALAVTDIDNDGQTDTLIPAGILWMQGESDGSYAADIAFRYEANLKRLMDLIRAAFRADDLPVVVGRISDSGKGTPETEGRTWNYGPVIRVAQQAFTDKDENASLVTSTDSYNYSDPFHYDSNGYIDLGKEFANAYYLLDK